MGSLSIMDARFRCGTRRLQLLSHGQVGIRQPQREDSWYRVHRCRLSNCHAYVKLKGLGCVDVVARFNGRAQFRKEKPRQAGSLLFGFASRKGVREQEAHLLCIYLSPNIKRRSLYALGVRLGWCCKSTTDLLVRMVTETRYISRYLCCFSVGRRLHDSDHCLRVWRETYVLAKRL